MTKHIAITGNLGSGKTTICRLFEQLDIPVYYSDNRAKSLMVNQQNLVAKIKKLLGKKAYNTDGSLDRAYVSSKIFSDKKYLQAINSLVHPAVKEDYLSWRDNQKSPFTIQESALTFEIGAEKIMDFTLVVIAPEELLIARGMNRDNKTKKEITNRLKKQMSQEQKIQKADFVISNGLGDNLLKPIIEIYHKLNSN